MDVDYHVADLLADVTLNEFSNCDTVTSLSPSVTNFTIICSASRGSRFGRYTESPW